MLEKNIALIGFMGSGKTTVGRLLAEAAGAGFADCDNEIVKSAGISISEIFKIYGESYFRKLEKETVSRLCMRHNMVISTGGGVVLDGENIAVLRESCYVVFLDVSPAELALRLKGDNTRPLLKGNASLNQIKRRLAARLPLYVKAAHLTVKCGHRSPEEMCAEITNEMKKRGIIK